MNFLNSCPVCNNTDIRKFLEHKQVPVHQNFPFGSKTDAKNAVRGDLTLYVCQNCEFIFNKTFDLSLLNYGKEYDNTQDLSYSFQNHISSLIEKLVNQKNVKNCAIIEVGCGRGGFIQKLIEEKQWNNTGYGFDPSFIGIENQFDGRLKFFKKFYDADCSDIAADVVISRHVIEHVPKPIELLQTIRKAIESSNNPHVYFETPNVDWILKNQVIWDFFYEHCSYFNPNSLTTAFEISGFQVENIDIIFGEQYMLLEAMPVKEHLISKKKSNHIFDLAVQFGYNEEKHRKNWTEKINKMHSQGNVAIWGAGAKGVTFVNNIDPDCRLVDCIVDVNPNKQGKFIAGTGHPIVHFRELPSRQIANIILMNPNYYNEVKQLLHESNLDISLVM